MSHAATANVSTSLSANDLETSLFGAAQTDPSVKFAAAMIMAMLDSGEGIRDLIFSPGPPPQGESHGRVMPAAIPQVPALQPVHTARVALELTAGNGPALL